MHGNMNVKNLYQQAHVKDVRINQQGIRHQAKPAGNTSG